MKIRLFALASVPALLTALGGWGASAQESISPLEMAKQRVESPETARTPPTTRKIVGGGPVDSDKYSFQVALVFSGTPEGLEALGQFCGASLIQDRWVLTAAHCVDDADAADVDTVIGARRLSQDGTPRGSRISVDDVIVHDGYNPATQENDIALLHLIEDAPAAVKRVTPADNDLDAAHAHDDADVLVIGWGRTTEGGEGSPDLMRVWVDVKNQAVCEANYQTVLPGVEINDTMLCAGVEGGGADSCQGDSGGYLGAPIGNGDYVQLGVVSWGIGCAREGLYGVYTRVGQFDDWIDSEIANF